MKAIWVVGIAVVVVGTILLLIAGGVLLTLHNDRESPLPPDAVHIITGDGAWCTTNDYTVDGDTLYIHSHYAHPLTGGFNLVKQEIRVQGCWRVEEIIR